MYYAYKYRLEPSDAHREELDRHRNICRQLYNHTLYRLNEYRESHGELPSMTTLRAELPDFKEWWDDLSDVYSKVLQTVVERLFDNLKGLSKLKKKGYGVGALGWKPPREFRGFTYSQSGFKLDKKGAQTSLSLSKLADIPIRLHRPIPDDATLKQVTVKKEPTGEWFATFGVQIDREPPEPPEEPERGHRRWHPEVRPRHRRNGSRVTRPLRRTEALAEATRLCQLREATTAHCRVSR